MAAWSWSSASGGPGPPSSNSSRPRPRISASRLLIRSQRPSGATSAIHTVACSNVACSRRWLSRSAVSAASCSASRRDRASSMSLKSWPSCATSSAPKLGHAFRAPARPDGRGDSANEVGLLRQAGSEQAEPHAHPADDATFHPGRGGDVEQRGRIRRPHRIRPRRHVANVESQPRAVGVRQHPAPAIEEHGVPQVGCPRRASTISCRPDTSLAESQPADAVAIDCATAFAWSA